MEIIEAVRDVNQDAVKCVVCGAGAHRFMGAFSGTLLCQNSVCYETIVTGINKLLVAIKNEESEVAA